jgi:hypothetical protein
VYKPNYLRDVNRLEVIDHRSDGLHGRVFSVRPCRVELSFQDHNRTLKVFVDDPAPEKKDV